MQRVEIKYLLLITVIFIAACIETDIYLPAFPDMMEYFSVSEEAIQSLLTWNFLGICLSGPFYGPISDAIGRKKPLLASLGIFLAGSLLTLIASDFNLMLWGRLLQGIGSGGCFTLGTAIIFDAFRAEKAISAINQLNLIIPFIMALAPLAGGYLNASFGFRSNFLVIALFVLCSLLTCLFFFDETLAKEKRAPFQTKKILDDFKLAISSVPFWQLTMLISMLFGAYLAFLSTTSVLFVLEMGVSKQVFPLFQAALLGAWLAGSVTCTHAIAKWGADKIKLAGTTLIAMGGIGMLIAIIAAPHHPYLLTGVMMLFIFGFNWVNSLYFPETMELLPEIKGVTASLLTSTRLAVGALIVGLSSMLYDGTSYPIACIVIGSIVVALGLIILYERNRTQACPLRIASAIAH